MGFFFGLRYYQNTLEQINESSIDIFEPPNFKIFKKSLYVFNNCFDYMNKNISSFTRIKNKLQKCYYLSPKKNFLGDFVSSIPRKHINISVHIRRGDALIDKHSYRLTSNQYILQNLVKLSNLLSKNGYGYSINVFSQGDHSEFEYLSMLENVRLFLDEDLFMTFDSLVASDILITSKSSFSYVAALLSNNIILYEPFWHPPLKSWLSLNDLNYDRRMSHKLTTLFSKRAK